ncbi:MAG: IS110 family transposase [Chloroflexi bacterium]|nr:IS110 family transposase [Chloroflexota bacterium]
MPPFGIIPLLAVPGVGVLTAARLVAEAGDVERFRSPAAFAMLAGVAPIRIRHERSSGCASTAAATAA